MDAGFVRISAILRPSGERSERERGAVGGMEKRSDRLVHSVLQRTRPMYPCRCLSTEGSVHSSCGRNQCDTIVGARLYYTSWISVVGRDSIFARTVWWSSHHDSFGFCELWSATISGSRSSVTNQLSFMLDGRSSSSRPSTRTRSELFLTFSIFGEESPGSRIYRTTAVWFPVNSTIINFTFLELLAMLAKPQLSVWESRVGCYLDTN